MKIKEYYTNLLKEYWKVKDRYLTGVVIAPLDRKDYVNKYVITNIETLEGRKITYRDGREINIYLSFIPVGVKELNARYKFQWSPICKWSAGVNGVRIKLTKKGMLSPINNNKSKEIIANKGEKTAEQEKILFTKLHDKRQNQYEVLNDHTTRAITKARRDIYSEEVHFIYELLQNADDEKASYAKFEIRDDSLLFWHNGAPFTISEDDEGTIPYGDINAITAPALDDPKKSEDVNKIGKFGVGFKSVYIYTDEPEIYSGHFNFKIVHQMVPVAIDECLYNKKNEETLFVLKFKNPEEDRKAIEKRLKSLDSPLLFLNHLKSIEWKVNEESHLYSKEATLWRCYDDINVNKIMESNDEEEIQFIMFSKSVDLKAYGTHNIYVGYQLDKNGNLDTSNYQKVYCFFPTKTSFGMVSVMQAPFILTQNREQVSPTEKINKILIKDLAVLMGETLPLLVDLSDNEKKYINVNLRSIIPYDYHGTLYWGGTYLRRGVTNEDCLKIFYDCLKEHLLNDALFLTASEEYFSKDKVMITSSKMRGLINREQLNSLMEKDNHELDFLAYDVTSDYKKFLINDIGLKEFDIDDLVDKIDSKFMESQSDEWIESLYLYANYSKTIKFCSFVKTNKGNFESLFNKNGDQNLFAPISSINMSGAYSDVKFIDSDTYSNHKNFFDRNGVKEPNRFDYLKLILKRFDECYNQEEEASDLSVILNIVNQFKGSTKEKEVYDLLRQRLRFEARCNNEPIRDLASNIFLPSEELMEFTTQNDTPVKILDINYYAESGFAKERIFSLAKILGAKSKGIIDKVLYASYKPFNEDENDNFNYVYRNVDDRSSYLESQDEKPLNFYEFCKLDDFDIINFEKIDFNRNLSKFIWETLLQYHSEYIAKSILYYRVWHGSRWYEYTFESSLINKLKKVPWIVNSKGEKVRPSDILIDEFRMLGYKEDNNWENLLEVGTHAQALLEAQKQESDQKISDMWNNDVEESAKWAKVKELCKERGIAADEMLSIFGNSTNSSNNNEYGDSYNLEGSENFNESGWSENDFENLKIPSLVRKTEHYIGVRLYEELLKKDNIAYEIPNTEVGDDYGYDIKVLPNKLVKISVIKDKEIDTNKYAPIGITKNQHAYMDSSKTNRYTIIRIALKDLEIDFDRDIRDIYGAEADIDYDEHLKAKCDKLVKDFWSSKTPDDFHNMISEYSIQILRELWSSRRNK